MRKELSSILDIEGDDLKIRARSASPSIRIDTFARCCASKRRWIMGIITPRHRRRCEGISVTSSALERHISSPRGSGPVSGSVAAVHHFGYNKQTRIWCPSSAYLGLRFSRRCSLRMPVLVRLNLRYQRCRKQWRVRINGHAISLLIRSGWRILERAD